jgi:hypothetical protein
MHTNNSPPAPTRGGPWKDGEEPTPAAEESIPSDGKDEKGEEMMEELGRERREKDASS